MEMIFPKVEKSGRSSMDLPLEEEGRDPYPDSASGCAGSQVF